jgi:acyl carrier protein
MTIDEIRTIISVQLGNPDVKPEDHIVQDLDAESADIVGIIAAIEDKYGINVDEEELAEIYTVEDLYRLAQKKIAILRS